MNREFKFEIVILDNGIIYRPLVLDGITLTSHYRGTATQLNLKVMKDKTLNFKEGSKIALKVDGVVMFDGFVFEKSRDKESIISIKAYDRLRYLQNKNSIEFTARSADKYVVRIANQLRMTCGELEDTKCILPHVVEEGSSYIDMILTALDSTKKQMGVEYIFFDNCGKLSLKSVESLKTKCLIDSSTLEDFEYTTSIDKDTYTKIRLEKNETGVGGDRQVQEEKDEESIEKWGVLTYYEKVQDDVNIKHRAVELLKEKNRRTITLFLKNVFGDVRVRAGSSVFVDLGLGDMNLKQYLLVTRCTHSFYEGEHLMSLDVKGGVIDE